MQIYEWTSSVINESSCKTHARRLPVIIFIPLHWLVMGQNLLLFKIITAYTRNRSSVAFHNVCFTFQNLIFGIYCIGFNTCSLHVPHASDKSALADVYCFHFADCSSWIVSRVGILKSILWQIFGLHSRPLCRSKGELEAHFTRVCIVICWCCFFSICALYAVANFALEYI